MSRRRTFEDDEVTLSHHNKRLCPGLTSYDRYTVAWMCALHIEMAAARAMLDEEHDSPPKTDSNSYVLGTIQKQHVVIACLPASAYGTNNAAIVLSDLKRTFPNIDVCLMVGIGGGVPTNKADIRLGDVVVGTRVMQYDLGKTINGELQRTGVYKHPGFSVLTVVSNLRSRHELEGSRLPAILKSKMEDHAAYGLPTEPDRLFKSTYNHPCPDFSCDECDQDRLEVRKTRLSSDPVIYYGAIASSNQVMKDATCRDKIAGELDILCFEMEAAGLMDIESCLPIRGICDYSDSHKAKGWQRYAAATAASYAYELLQVRGQDSWEVEVEPPTDDEEDEEAQRRKKRKREQRRKKILESLDFEAIDTRKTTIKFADRKTCQWFLKNKEYLVWKDPAKVSDHHGFLWIRGKPGAGKSTIMKFIYLATRKKDKKNEILTASFFFNARGETLEKTISGMYRSLLLQLLIGFPDLQNVLDDSDLLPQHQTTCPSLNCLKTIFQSAVLKLGRRTFTCFIDALDECDEQQVMDLVRYFEDIAEVCTENRVCLRICFSSRHYPYIDINRGMRLTLENQEGHADDLGSYIKSNLRIKDKDLVTELEDKMLAKASGVFLWVVLVVDVLNDENRRGRLNLRNRLEQIPNGLSELFQDILRRDASNAEELQLCLLWILFSKRPLRPDEYYHALWSGLYLEGLADSEMPRVDGTDAGDCFNKSVISSSKGLAEITKAKIPTVQFIHESVRDFLIKDRGLAEIWPGFQADWESFGHDKLKRCCHLYLQLCYTMETDIPKAEHLLMANRPLILYERNIKKRYPFVEYASQHVLDHADSASNTYCQVGFMRAFPTYDWISIVNEYEMDEARRYTLEADILYILADRGCSSLIRTTLKADPAINVDILGSKERYGHPLTAAMANGDKESVVALLKLASPVHEGVDLTVGMTPRIDSIVEHPTPLSWACENGHLGIAKLLVQRGMSKDVDGNWTLFTLALENGNIETVKWLMGIEDDIRKLVVPDTAIFLAVKNGCADIVELLLNRGIKPDSVISSTPILCLALAQGHDAIVRLILEKGGDVAVETKFNKRPIHLAKSKASMKALIEHGADINARDSSGRTALWDLIRDSRLGELDFLCQNGADVNAQDNEGNTCLHVACLDRIDDLIFPILLKYGGDINARNNDGNTPLLLAASRWGHENFKLDAWVTHGADINAQNNRGQTLLDFAVDGGDTEAVAFLAQRGAARGIRVPGLRNEGYNIIGTLNKN